VVAALVVLIAGGFEAVSRNGPHARPERHSSVPRVLTATGIDVLDGPTTPDDCSATADVIVAAGHAVATSPTARRALRALTEQRRTGGRILCASGVDVLP
jgi:hypothetical protein